MIELISIGEELLLGSIVDTNSVFLSQELFKLGYEVTRHTTLSDDPESLKKGIQEALARSKVVITTGGLGPTCDDLTRACAAEIFHSDFRFDEDIARDLKKRFGELVIALEDQATVPTKATILPNKLGTAPGLMFEEQLILLPGVPQEMKALFTEQVVPFLKSKYPADGKIKESLYFCPLAESAVDPYLRKVQLDHPETKIGIYPTWGVVAVRMIADKKESIIPFVEVLKKQFATYLFPSEHGRIEEAIHYIFRERNLKLAFAESCTGGLLSEKITAMPRASDYFLGSVVAYSNQLKQALLGVSSKTLSEFGAVSSQTVEEMLNGIFEKTEADYAIAVSGIAGPTGGTPEKPVGTIWAAMGPRGEKPDIWTFKGIGNRETVIVYTANQLFAALWRKIAYGVKGGT